MRTVVAVAGKTGIPTVVDLQILGQCVAPLAIRVKNHVRENSCTQVELYPRDFLVIGRVVAQDKGILVKSAGIDAIIRRDLHKKLIG